MTSPQQQEIEALVASAIDDIRERSSASAQRFAPTVQRLLELDQPDMVDTALIKNASQLLAPAWDRGWTPLDVIHATGNVLDAESSSVVARLIQADPALAAPHRPAAWEVEFAAVARAVTGGRRRRDADHCLRRLRLCRFLLFVPRLAPVMETPARWATGTAQPSADFSGAVDQRTVERIRALLAKAEATNFEAEAIAFSGKAQELMARYAIDVAMLMDQAPGDALRAGVRARRVHIDAPYAPEKAQLLAAVANVNGARALWHADFQFSTVAGFPVELELVTLAFTSLLVQMSHSMVGVAASAGGRGRSPAFRRAFVVSFADRIAERLEESRRQAEQEAAREYGSALVPVRNAQEEAVKDQMSEWFPDTKPFSRRTYDAAGWNAGRRAADNARLEPGQAQLAR